MKNLIYSLTFVLCLSATCFPQRRVIRSIPVRQHPFYAANVLPALRELVAQQGRAKRNHFYVGRVNVREGGYESVLVYWKENRALVLWEPGRGHNAQGDPDPRFDLRDSRRYWRLNKDVVPTMADVGGSSFLITRDEALQDIRACIQHGERYVINRK